MLTVEEMLEEHIHTGAHHQQDFADELRALELASTTQGNVKILQVLNFRTRCIGNDSCCYNIGCFTCLRASRLRPFLDEDETKLLLVDQRCGERMNEIECPSTFEKKGDCFYGAEHYNVCMDKNAFVIVATSDRKSVCHFHRVRSMLSYE